MTMTKDQAVDIAYTAKDMTLEQLLRAYGNFHDIVENTPEWLSEGPLRRDPENGDVYHGDGKSHAWQRALHGSIGLCTESAELLDAFKKELYGKNKSIRTDNIREECGDSFFYLWLVMKGLAGLLNGGSCDADATLAMFRASLQDNVVKLANRYIERFGD